MTQEIQEYINKLSRQSYLHIGRHIMSNKMSDMIKEELINKNIKYFSTYNSYGVEVIKLSPIVEKDTHKRTKEFTEKINTMKSDLINGKVVHFGKCIKSSLLAQTIIYDFNCNNITHHINSNSHGVYYIKLG